MARLFDHDVAQPTRPKAQKPKRRDREPLPELDAGAPRAIWAALLEHGADPGRLAALLRDGLPASERRRAYLELVRDLGLERAAAVWTEAFRPGAGQKALPAPLKRAARELEAATSGTSLTAIHVVTGELVEVLSDHLQATVGVGAEARAGERLDPIARERARARLLVGSALERAPKIRAGRALPASLRHDFERSLGTSLGEVRVHDDPEAASEARARGAVAFARGSDLYFADGRYQPETREGRHLLAHELTHVVQARGAGASSTQATEREAAQVAQAVTAGRPAPRISGALPQGAEAHADEAAAQVEGPFHLTLATQSFTAELSSGIDLPNGYKRVTVSQSKIGPIVIDSLEVLLDGTKVKEGTLHAHVDDGRFKGLQGTLHVDDKGKITGSLDVGIDVPGILVKHVTATLSETGLGVTLALEGNDFVMQDFPVSAPRMSITVAQSAAGLDVELVGDVTVRLPPGFAEGQGTLTAKISTGTTPGAEAVIAAKVEVPGLGLGAEATIRFDGKNIVFEGAAVSLPIDLPGLSGLAKIGYQPGSKFSVEIPDLDFTLPSLKNKFKFSDLAIGGGGGGKGLKLGKLSGTIAAPDGTELDLKGFKASLHDTWLSIDGKNIAGSIAGDLELVSGTKGSFALSYSKDGGFDGDVTFDGKKFPLGGGEAVIDPGAHLHVKSKERSVTGTLSGSVQLGPIPKLDLSLTREDPDAPTVITAHTSMKLSQIVPSLDGDVSASYDGTLKSGRFTLCVDNPGVKDLPGSHFLEKIELSAGKGGFEGSVKALPGAKFDAKGHTFTVSEGHVDFKGGVLDGEVKGKVEGSIASGDVAVGWKHGKFSMEAEGEVDLAEATKGQVTGKVKGRTGGGKGTQLELVVPPGATFSNEKLKGLVITEITGDTKAKTFSIAVQGAELVNDLTKDLKSVEVKLDDAVARIEVAHGKVKVAGGMQGSAVFKPGGKEVASGQFVVGLDETGFGGEVLVDHFTVSDKLKGENLLVDLRTGLKGGAISFNVDGVVSGRFDNLQVQPKEGVFGFEGEAHFDKKLGGVSKVGIHTKLEAGVFTAEARLEEGMQLDVPGGAQLKLHAGESHAKLEQGHFSAHLAGEAAMPGELATGQFHLDLEGKTFTGQVNAKTKKVGAFKEGTAVDLTWQNGKLEGDAHLELGAPFDQYFTSAAIDLSMHHGKFDVTGTINGPITKLGKLGETFKTATVHWDNHARKVTAHAELNLATIPTFGEGSHATFDFVDNRPEIHGHVKIGQLGSLKLDKNEITFDWVAQKGIHIKGEAAATIDGLGTVEVTADTRTDEGAPKFSLDGKITASQLAQKFKGVTFADPPSAKVTINNTDGKWDFGVDDLGTKIVGIQGIDAVDIDFNAHWTKQKGLGCIAAVRKLQVKSFNFTGMLTIEQGKFQGGVLNAEADFPGIGLLGGIEVTPSEMDKPSIKASLTAIPKGSGAIAKFVKTGHLDIELVAGHLKKAEGKIDLNPPEFLGMKDTSVAISYSEGGEVMGHLHSGFTVPLGDGIEGELDVWVGGKEHFRLELGFPFSLPGFEESRVFGSIDAAGHVKIAGQFKPKDLPFLKMAEIGIEYKNGFSIYGFVIIEPSPEHELKLGVRYDLSQKKLVTDGIDYKEKENPAPPEPPLHKDLFNKKIPLFGVGVLNVALSLRFSVGAALAKPKLKLDKPEIVGGLESMDKGEMPEIRFGGDVGVGVDLSMEFGIGIAGQIQLLIAEADVGIEGVAKAILNLMIGSKVKGSFKQGEGAKITIDPYVQATLKLLAELNAFFYAEVCWFTIIDKKWPLAGVELASIPLGELHPFKPMELAVGGPQGTKLSTPEVNLDVDQIVDGVQKGSEKLSDDQANEDARNKLKPVLQSMKAAGPQFEKLPPNWRDGMTAAPVSFDDMFHVPDEAWDFYREHADDAETIDPGDAMSSPTERLAKAVAVLSKWNPYMAGMLVLSWRRAQIAHEGVNPDTGVDVVAEQKVVQEEQDAEFQLELTDAQTQQKAQDDEHTKTVAKQGQDYAHAEAEHQKKDEKTRTEFAHRTQALEKEGQGAQAKVDAAAKEADKAGVHDKPAPTAVKPLEKPPAAPLKLHKLEKPAPIPPKPPVPVPQPPPQIAPVALPALPDDPGVSPPATRPIPKVQKPISIDTPAPNPQPQAPPASQPSATSSATTKGGGGKPLGDGPKAPPPAPKAHGGGAPTPAPHVAAGPDGIISQQKTLDAKKTQLDGQLKSHGAPGAQPMQAPPGAGGGPGAGAAAAKGDPKKGKPGEKASAGPVDPTVQKVIDAGKKDEEHQKKEAEKKQDVYKTKVGKAENEAGQAETQLVAATTKAKTASEASAAATGAGPTTQGGPAGGTKSTPRPRVRANISDFPMPTPEEARVAYSNWLKLKLSGQTFLSFQEKLAMLQYFNFEKKTFSSVITEWEILKENAGPHDVVPEPKFFAQKLFTGHVFDGKTFHRAAAYDPSYSLSDEAIKALATLEKFKATYRGNKPGDYLVDEAQKLMDAAMTTFVWSVLEPLANTLDALRALRAAIYRMGPPAEVQKKLAMVDAGKVDAPAFWTFLGTHFKTGGGGLEQVNAALEALEHTLKQSAPAPSVPVAPAQTAGAAPASAQKPQAASKPVEKKDDKPHLRTWAEVAPRFAALAADRALEDSLAAFGVHAGQPAASNQQGMLAVKRKELEALAKTMPGKKPEEVHAAWRKDAHARALAHNKLVLDVTRKYALLISELREKEPRLDQDGVQHAVAAFRQRIGSNTLLFAVPQLNPAACKPEEKVDAGLPLATVAGADWNPLLSQAWLQSSFEAFDPAAGAKVAPPPAAADAKPPQPQPGTHAEQASLTAPQPAGAKPPAPTPTAVTPPPKPALEPPKPTPAAPDAKKDEVKVPSQLVAAKPAHITEPSPSLEAEILKLPASKDVNEAQGTPQQVTEALLKNHPDAHLDAGGRLTLPPLNPATLAAAKSLADLAGVLAAQLGVSKVHFTKTAGNKLRVEVGINPECLALDIEAAKAKGPAELKKLAQEAKAVSAANDAKLRAKFLGLNPVAVDRIIVGAGYAAVANFVNLLPEERAKTIAVGFAEPWLLRGDVLMGQTGEYLKVAGFPLQPEMFNDKNAGGYLPSSAFADATAFARAWSGMSVFAGWAGPLEERPKDKPAGAATAALPTVNPGAAKPVAPGSTAPLDEKPNAADKKIKRMANADEHFAQKAKVSGKVAVYGAGASAAWNVEKAKNDGAKVDWVGSARNFPSMDPLGNPKGQALQDLVFADATGGGARNAKSFQGASLHVAELGHAAPKGGKAASGPAPALGGVAGENPKPAANPPAQEWADWGYELRVPVNTDAGVVMVYCHKVDITSGPGPARKLNDKDIPDKKDPTKVTPAQVTPAGAATLESLVDVDDGGKVSVTWNGPASNRQDGGVPSAPANSEYDQLVVSIGQDPTGPGGYLDMIKKLGLKMVPIWDRADKATRLPLGVQSTDGHLRILGAAGTSGPGLEEPDLTEYKNAVKRALEGIKDTGARAAPGISRLGGTFEAANTGKPVANDGKIEAPVPDKENPTGQPKALAAKDAVSKHGRGKPESGWRSQVVASVPSEKVVADDPGHTYHVLSDGKAVATTEPAQLDPATTQVARTVAGAVTQKDQQQPSNIPPGVMDPAVVAQRPGSFVVGRPLQQVGDGHSILGALSQGDPNALKPVGVGMLPFVANSVEWGLGEWNPRTPPGAAAPAASASPVFRIVKGDSGAVDWGQVPDLRGIGHSHPARQLNPFDKNVASGKYGDGSMRFDDLIRIDRNRAKIAPSSADFHYVYTNGVERHVVHTPYQMDPQTREVFNPTEMRTVMVHRGQPLTFVIQRNLMAPKEGVPLYHGTLVASAGGTEVWRGGFECWARNSGAVCDMLPSPIQVAAPPAATSQGGATQAGSPPKDGAGAPNAGDAKAAEKKDIGARVGFEAGGHAHTQYIDKSSGEPVPMVASTPVTVASKLGEWRPLIKQLSDADQKKAAELLGRAQKQDEIVRLLAKQVDAGKPDTELRAEQQVLTDTLLDLFVLMDNNRAGDAEVKRLVYAALGDARRQLLEGRTESAKDGNKDTSDFQAKFSREMHLASSLYEKACSARGAKSGSAKGFTQNVFTYAGGDYFVDHQNNYILPASDIPPDARAFLDGRVYAWPAKVRLTDPSQLADKGRERLIAPYRYTDNESAKDLMRMARLVIDGAALHPSDGAIFLAMLIAEGRRNPNAHVTNQILLKEGGTESFKGTAPMVGGGTDSPKKPRDAALTGGITELVRVPPQKVTDKEIAIVRERFEKAQGSLVEQISKNGAAAARSAVAQFLIDAARMLG